MLKRKSLRLTSIVVCLILVMSTFSVSADFSPDEYVVTIEEARKAAISHVVDISNSDPECVWKNGVELKAPIELYDFDDNISGYLFEVNLLNGTSSGYIVVAGSKLSNPIAEYSTSSETYFKQVETQLKAKTPLGKQAKMKTSKIYYLGGIDYYAKLNYDNGQEEIVSLNDQALPKLDASEIKIIKNAYRKEKAEVKAEAKAFKTEVNSLNAKAKSLEELDVDEATQSNLLAWHNVLSRDYETLLGADEPKDSNIVTDPTQYESGYTSVKYGNVDTMGYVNKTFETTSSLSTVNGKSYPNNCVPVACTNLMLYNKRVYDYHGWTCKLWKGSAADTFVELCARVQYPVLPNGGAYASAVPGGLRSYSLSVGDKHDSKYYNKPDFQVIEQEIYAYHPVIYSVTGHSVYGNHAVLALAFRNFEYTTLGIFKTHQGWVQVADGWTNTASRYIHFVQSKVQIVTFFATNY